MLKFALACALVSFIVSTPSDTPPRAISVIPTPTEVHRQPGEFLFARPTVIETTPDCGFEARYLSDLLRPGLGRSIIVSSEGPNDNAVSLKVDPTLSGLGEEGYELSVRPERIEIRAAKPAGVFYGVQTLRQL